ncbi:MAG: hypothetical protein K2O32_10550 [Acetatifactor sp.]|nr:hypothetical protein [Acetatifactor sp.]
MKKIGIGIVCMAALLMTGCGADLPDMTDEEINTIGEYAAITLLKYDVNARSRLVDASVLEELQNIPEPELPSVPEQKPEPEPEPEPATEVPVVDNSVAGEMTAESLESFLELPEGVNLSFTEYEVCQSYQEDNQYFSLDASEGKELLVLHFTLRNASGSDQSINMLARRDKYRVTVNGSSTRNALPTLLTNDLTTYKGTLGNGASEDVVLVIELSPEELTNVTSITINFKNELNAYTIQAL